MQKHVILGSGNRSNAGMDIVTLNGLDLMGLLVRVGED
jgi:hypothetical protein